MTVSKEQASEAAEQLAQLAEYAPDSHLSTPALATLRQFIEQSQDSGHAAALTDKVLLYVKSYLAEREDWPGTEDLIEDINFALAAAPAPTDERTDPRALAAPAPTQQPTAREVIPPSAMDWATQSEPPLAVTREWIDGWDACRNYVSSAALSRAAPTQQPRDAQSYEDERHEEVHEFLAERAALSGAAPTPQPELPLMRAAFRTSVSSGPDKLYEIRFKFPSLDAMQAADREWASLLGAAPTPQPELTLPEPIGKIFADGYWNLNTKARKDYDNFFGGADVYTAEQVRSLLGAAPTQAVAWARSSELESDEPTVIAPATYARLSADARSEFVPLVVGAVAPTQAPQQPVAAGVAMPRGLDPNKVQICRVASIDYDNGQPCGCPEGTCKLGNGGQR